MKIYNSEILQVICINHEVHLISNSRLMMAYGLGRNIALLQTSLKSFNSPSNL